MVFLHEHNAESSAWVRAHDKGIEALQQAFPDRVFITRKENIEPEVDAEQVLEDVAHDNADEMCIRDSTGSVAVTVVWKWMYNNYYGIFNYLGKSLGTVSYTHLDVYKRQVYRRLLFGVDKSPYQIPSRHTVCVAI